MALRILVTAAAYFLAGRLALSIAAAPGYAVAIWPAAGIGLAALLLFGYRLWLGVFLGSLAVNLTVSFDATSAEAFLVSLAAPAGIAAGASVQAFAGAWLIRRLAGFPSRQERPGNLLRSMALGGPLACLLSAVVGVAVLERAGRIADGELAATALTWWSGDVLGVVLLLPLVSEWRREMGRASLRARLRVGVPILLAALVTIVGFLSVRATEASRRDEEFARRAEIMAHSIDTALQNSFEVVRGIAASLSTFDDVSPQQFRGLVRDALDRRGDLRAVGWNRVVAHPDIPALEAQARARGLEGFYAKQAGPDGALIPVLPRGSEPHVVVYYIEPLEGNERAHGYDVASDADRRSAIEAVVAHGGIAATPPLRLVQEEGEQYGFLLFAPIYADRGAGAGEVAAGAQPVSYAVGVFRVGDMLADSLQAFDREGIRYKLMDTTERAAPRALLPGPTDAQLAASRLPPMRWLQDLDVAQRRWTVSFWPTAAYGAGFLWGRAWLALTGGLLCTCLLGVYLLVQAGRAAATARTNEELRLRMDERRRAATALGASEHQYRTLVENLPGAVYRCTPDDEWTIQYLSDEMSAISGYPVDRFYGDDGWTYAQIVHPEDLADLRRTVAAAVAAREPFVCEYRILTADGEVRWVYEKGQAAFDPDGEPQWLDGVIVDVTQRRQAEEALRESAAMLAEAQRIGQMGSWEYDVRAERLAWSDEAYRLLDVDRARTAYPGFEAYLERVHPEERALVGGHLDAALAEAEAYELEHRIVRRDGRLAHLRSAAEIQRDHRGRPLRIVGTILDVTQRVELEAEQRRLEARMQEAQKLESLGVLAGGIAHDFNNILTSVLGHADCALDELPSDAPVRDRLHSIMAATRRAADLCEQMLAYSGRGQFVVEPLDLRGVVEEMSHMLQASVSKTADLRFDFAPDLPSMRGDASQIRQVVLNLITNASEALEDGPGTITVSTGTTECGADCEAECHGACAEQRGEKVFLEVADTGCGMSGEVLERLFEPFYTTKFTGRGLGMSALLGIVRGHQGCVRVFTRESAGTRVRVCFPAAAAAAAAEPDRRHEAAQPLAAAGARTILLVDDEPGVREVGRSMLETLGYDVVTAADGEEGVACYRAHRERIVAVVLDLTMPRQGGRETFRALRRIDPDVRVILSSGYSGTAVLSAAQGEDFACFIQKPYRLADLRDALRTALGRTRGTRRAGPHESS